MRTRKQNTTKLCTYFMGCSVDINPLYHACSYKCSWWRHQTETFSALLAFVRGIHRSPVNSPHKGQWHGALMFSLIWARTNGWVNNRDAGDLRRHGAHYDVSVMCISLPVSHWGGVNSFHYTNDIFKCLFLNVNLRILIKISLISFLEVHFTISRHRFR